MENPGFIYYRSGSLYYYRLRSGSGEVILSGEDCESEESCLNAIGSVKRNARFYSSYEKRSADSGGYYFVLMAPNGKIIGRSETYRSWFARERGMATVMNDAPYAPIAGPLFTDVIMSMAS